jgi:hypothetical protein
VGKPFLQSSELGLPQLLTRRRVFPPPLLVPGGGAHSLAKEGWESLNSDEGTYTVVLCINMYFVGFSNTVTGLEHILLKFLIEIKVGIMTMTEKHTVFCAAKMLIYTLFYSTDISVVFYPKKCPESRALHCQWCLKSGAVSPK